MNKIKLSAIVLGLAAAGAFAQNAPAAAAEAPKAEAPVVNADSVKAAEEAKAAEAKKAEEEKAAAEAKKAEEEKAAAEAKKAEEEKAAAEAKKAEEEKAAAEAKKAEEEKAAAEAKKAEEAKSAEAAPAAENTNPDEVSAAASSAFAAIKASFSQPTSVANMEVKVSGYVEADWEAGDFTETVNGHKYYTDAMLNVDVKFNSSWSAFLSVEAFNGNGAGAGFGYDQAYVQYKPADAFAIKVGDIEFSEGAFKSYYGYDDPTENAVGMVEHEVRGIEIDLAGLEFVFGFAVNDDNGSAYNAHVAYEFNYAGQHLRPFFDYKSYQALDHNQMHAGIDAGLTIGGFSFRAVYGLHMDYLIDDNDYDTAGLPNGKLDKKGRAKTFDKTSMAHVILAEPSFEMGMFQINTSFLFAITSEGEDGNEEYAGEVPESMLLFAEPAFKLAEFIKLGIPLEVHTNSYDFDFDAATIDVGARAYITPVENLEMTAYGMIDIAIGDDAPVAGDLGLRFGLETVFKF